MRSSSGLALLASAALLCGCSGGGGGGGGGAEINFGGGPPATPASSASASAPPVSLAPPSPTTTVLVPATVVVGGNLTVTGVASNLTNTGKQIWLVLRSTNDDRLHIVGDRAVAVLDGQWSRPDPGVGDRGDAADIGATYNYDAYLADATCTAWFSTRPVDRHGLTSFATVDPTCGGPVASAAATGI